MPEVQWSWKFSATLELRWFNHRPGGFVSDVLLHSACFSCSVITLPDLQVDDVQDQLDELCRLHDFWQVKMFLFPDYGPDIHTRSLSPIPDLEYWVLSRSWLIPSLCGWRLLLRVWGIFFSFTGSDMKYNINALDDSEREMRRLLFSACLRTSRKVGFHLYPLLKFLVVDYAILSNFVMTLITFIGSVLLISWIC